jgi:hypothetical protein
MKGAISLLVIALLLPLAWGSITIVTETDTQTVTSGDIIELGDASPGETLNLTISSDIGVDGVDVEWSKLEIDKSTLPEDWNAWDSSVGEKTLTAKIVIPTTAELDAFKFRALVTDEGSTLNEEFSFWIFLKKNLIVSSINNLEKKVTVNQPAKYELTLINNSVAEHKVKVHSSLPLLWFEGRDVLLKANESQTLELEVTPRIYGFREFTFYVTSQENGQLLNLIPARIEAEPLLKEKYATGIYGFPFFTLSLLPYYLLEGLASLLIP